MASQAKKYGAAIERGTLTALARDGDGFIAAVETANGKTYAFDTLYSAPGSLPQSETLRPLGVHLTPNGCVHCGDHQCNSVPLFRGRHR